MVVLVGKNTRCRKHVDWEISAALNKKVGGYCGIIGILLPDFPLIPEGQLEAKYLPPRLADNVKSGYAELYSWDWICLNESNIKSAINKAFSSPTNDSDKIDNSRQQFINNRKDTLIEPHTALTNTKGVNTQKLPYTGLSSEKSDKVVPRTDVRSYQISLERSPTQQIRVTQIPAATHYRPASQRPPSTTPSRPRYKPHKPHKRGGIIITPSLSVIRQRRGTVI